AEDHPLAGAVAMPVPPQLPERILLGGSPDSGALAARNGWRFCYAGHFNGDDANLERSLDAYRSAGGEKPLVALYAVAAPTRDQLARYVADVRAQAAAAGRDPAKVLIYNLVTVIVDETDEKAQAKFDEYRRYVSYDGSLVFMSGWTGIDFGQYAPTDP
ncbi:LLM class flavin-dependent oxidoreductase, partial [Bacillus licheniformis]|nr:LLM class flavin-dependent oxidoreductase [Bacillus licheniformis]